MGWDRHKLQWDGTDKYVPWTTRTIVQSSHFYDRLLTLNSTFHHHDRGLTKFFAGSEQSLLYVVINISHHPAVKTNSPAYHALGKY